MRAGVGVILGACAVCAVASAPASAEAPARLDDARLTRARAVQVAVAGNVGLMASKIVRAQAARGARRARRPYVPFVSAAVGYRDSASLFEPGVTVRQLDYSAGVSWATAAGTTLSVDAGSTEFFSGTSFVPTPATSVQLAISQSILRGWMAGQNQLDEQDLEVKRAREVFVGELNDFIAGVDRAYWELAYAQADLEIKVRSRDRARVQYDETKENIARGLLAPGEIFIVEENLVFFEQNLVAAQESLELARVRLARLLRVAPETPLEAIDSLDDADGLAARALGMSNEEVARANPRAKAAQAGLAQAEARLAFEENQALPSLDARASLGFNGLDPRREVAWGQAVTGANPDARLGVSFSTPILRDAEDARAELARAERERARLELRQARDEARYGAQELGVQIQARRERLALATRRVGLALSKLDNEQEKYKSGISTLPNVVLFQRDLDSARIAERRAQADLAALASRMFALRGELPARAGLEVR
jgi:outer membrane protein TolC